MPPSANAHTLRYKGDYGVKCIQLKNNYIHNFDSGSLSGVESSNEMVNAGH
jgi:hypothetical protein